MITFPQTPDKLTATEQAIIEYITRHRDEFLLMTIGQLAKKLDVSEATVSRFARHVGCEDFRHLRRVVMEQTVGSGPAHKLTNTLRAGSGDFFTGFKDRPRENLQRTMELLDPSEFETAASAICCARRVFVHARNASRAPAQLLEYRLSRIGIDIRPMPTGGAELSESLAQIGETDLVILFGFSKLSAQGRAILDYQRRVGYRTMMFTGRAYQEEALRADINLFVYRGEEDEYHSMTAPAAVCDALVLAVSSRLGDTALERLKTIAKLKREYGERG